MKQHQDPTATLQRCSACKTNHYCNAVCQRQDWQTHRYECPALRAMNKDTVIDTGIHVRLAARLFLEKRRRGNEWWQVFDSLESHEELVDEHDLEKLQQFFRQFASQDNDAHCSLLKTILGLVQTNGLIVSSPDGDWIGSAIYPVAARINHSCSFNATFGFPNGVDAHLSVVACTAIDSGEELTIPYIDIADPYSVRQKLLAQKYGFDCQCRLCLQSKTAVGKTGKTFVDPRQVMWCSSPGCKGWIPFTLRHDTDRDSTGNPAPTVNHQACSKCRKVDKRDMLPVWEAVIDGEKVLSVVRTQVNKGGKCRPTSMKASSQEFPFHYRTLCSPDVQRHHQITRKDPSPVCIPTLLPPAHVYRALSHFGRQIRSHITHIFPCSAGGHSPADVYIGGHASRSSWWHVPQRTCRKSRT